MNSLDWKSLEESIGEILKSLDVVTQRSNEGNGRITEMEKRFYTQWRELGCRLFENQIQEAILTYEQTQSGAKQRWSRNYHTRLGTIRLERKAYASPEGLKGRQVLCFA